jgi:hypothetical protein
VCRTALFVTVQEHFIAHCRCREVVKLFVFVLSPYSLIATCNSLLMAARFGDVTKIYVYFREGGVEVSRNYRAPDIGNSALQFLSEGKTTQ